MLSAPGRECALTGARPGLRAILRKVEQARAAPLSVAFMTLSSPITERSLFNDQRNFFSSGQNPRRQAQRRLLVGVSPRQTQRPYCLRRQGRCGESREAAARTRAGNRTSVMNLFDAPLSRLASLCREHPVPCLMRRA